jgi:beta-lactam-binding protein with PASTA domain
MTSAGNTEPLVPRVANTVNDPPGTPADPGPTVDNKIPDVSGRSLEEAVRIISGAGFEVTDIKTEASQRAQDTAIRTEPAAGAPAKSGTPVVLTMSAGSPIATPSATASPTPAYAN